MTPKRHKTRQEQEKNRKLRLVLKILCWISAFCIVVSLIKIASVFALKGDNVEYVSENSLPAVRILICAHAILALLAILSRHPITMAIVVLLTIALFVVNFCFPIYAQMTECGSDPDERCQYALDYHENNIYDF